MKKSTLAIIISVVAIVAIGGIIYITTQDRKTKPTASQTSTNETQSETTNASDTTETESTTSEKKSNTQTSETDGTYTTSEVATHNTESDCWTIIDGSVYDITSYVPRHPGGDEIVLACGTDGSSLFNQRKTSSGEEVGSGTAHSGAAQSQLAQLKIGVLAQD